MAYTVKQVAALSGVSVRTLHFYDETDLLKPAHTGANGYRYYEEPQLLTLQQILLYRELGIELRQIRQLLGRPDFQRRDALRSHREAMEERLARTRRLLETIDHTIDHLEGKRGGVQGGRAAPPPARGGEHVRAVGPRTRGPREAAGRRECSRCTSPLVDWSGSSARSAGTRTAAARGALRGGDGTAVRRAGRSVPVAYERRRSSGRRWVISLSDTRAE
jgi:DNA-binding transcriptional MerR regulator